MAENELDKAVQGAVRPSFAITWADADGVAVDLTGATLTGTIRNLSTGVTRAIAGALVITNAVAGVFRWDFAAGDVAEAGRFTVQFNAAYGAGATPGKTFPAAWTIVASQTVS